MNKRLQRARANGKLMTRAWNPDINIPAFTQITIDGKQQELVSVPVPAQLSMGKAVAIDRAFFVGDYGIRATVDKTRHGNLLHISVSHHSMIPTWDVMIAIKRVFFHEDVAAVMMMPEEEVYVNLHPFTLHIWQLPEKWGIR